MNMKRSGLAILSKSIKDRTDFHMNACMCLCLPKASFLETKFRLKVSDQKVYIGTRVPRRHEERKGWVIYALKEAREVMLPTISNEDSLIFYGLFQISPRVSRHLVKVDNSNCLYISERHSQYENEKSPNASYHPFLWTTSLICLRI